MTTLRWNRTHVCSFKNEFSDTTPPGLTHSGTVRKDGDSHLNVYTEFETRPLFIYGSFAKKTPTKLNELKNLRTG